MVVIGIDPGLTGAIVILDDNNHVAIHDMPTQVKAVKRKRVKTGKLKGQMKDYPSYEVSSEGVAAIIHPAAVQYLGGPVTVYIEKIGAVFRQDKQTGTDAHQPLHATFVQGEGCGVLRGICEAFYGKANVVRVAPATWKKHCGLLKTEKDAARIYAINNVLLDGVPDLLKRKKDGGRADALLIATYGLHQELEK